MQHLLLRRQTEYTVHTHTYAIGGGFIHLYVENICMHVFILEESMIQKE